MPTGVYPRRPFTKEYRLQLSLAHRGIFAGDKHPLYGKIGKEHPFFGRHHTQESIELIRKSRLGIRRTEESKRKQKESISGNKHWNWKGGISCEPYSPTFNQQLKDRIRVRDNFICQKCGTPELEFNQRLTIHHIDYNKKNSEESNLVSLCNKCNFQVNRDRAYWTAYFQNKLRTR